MEIPYAQRKYKKIAETINATEKRIKILDIGCGTGEISEYFDKGKVEYCGVDVDPGNLDQLAKRGVRHFDLDLTQKEFKLDEKFDYILLLDVLEHLANPTQILQNIKSLLIPDGTIFVSLPNDYNLLNKIRFLLNKNIQKDPFWEYGHLHIFPIKTAIAFIQKNGFDIVEKEVLYSHKPEFLPDAFKRAFANTFKNDFARGMLYKLKVKN